MGKYLDFYKKCMDSGEMPFGGLCKSGLAGVALFTPSNTELQQHKEELGYGDNICNYWAAGLEWYVCNSWERTYSFTPLRQNIILLLAAMNGEL